MEFCLYGTNKILWFYIFRPLGLFPVIYKKSEGKVCFSKPLAIYSLALQVILIGAGYWTGMVDVFSAEKGPLRLKTMTETVFVYFDFVSLHVSAGVVGLSSCFKCSRIINIFRSIQKIDILLGIKRQSAPVPKYSIVCISSLFFISIARYYLDKLCFCMLTFDILLFIVCLMNMQFLNIVTNIGLRYKVLNEKINQLAIREKDSHLKVSDVHYAMSKLIEDVSSSFGLQITGALLFYIVQLTMTLYNINTFFIRTTGLSTVSLVRQIGFFFMFCWQTACLVLPCEFVSNEALKSNKYLTRWLKSDFFHCDLDDSKVISTVKQLQFHNFTFSPWGLFKLRTRMLTSITSGVIMYWSILTQFQILDDKIILQSSQHKLVLNGGAPRFDKM